MAEFNDFLQSLVWTRMLNLNLIIINVYLQSVPARLNRLKRLRLRAIYIYTLKYRPNNNYVRQLNCNLQPQAPESCTRVVWYAVLSLTVYHTTRVHDSGSCARLWLCCNCSTARWVILRMDISGRNSTDTTQKDIPLTACYIPAIWRWLRPFCKFIATCTGEKYRIIRILKQSFLACAYIQSWPNWISFALVSYRKVAHLRANEFPCFPFGLWVQGKISLLAL